MIHILSDIVVTLALASVVLVLAHRLHIPPILGFIITGVLIGPYGLELISATDQVEMMAEVGVVLLLFSIGLEISFKSLWHMRKIVFGGGGTQVLLTALGSFALFSVFQAEPRVAVFGMGRIGTAAYESLRPRFGPKLIGIETDLGKVERCHRRVHARRPGKARGDRHAHVGRAELRERRSVA